jgi:hypothetical protein
MDKRKVRKEMAKAKAKKEYTAVESRDLMAEIKTGRRVFDTEKYGLVQIRFPKVEENRLADWEYSKVFQKAVMDDIPTNKEMTKFIERKGLWGKEEEDKIASIQEEITKQIAILGKMTEGSANYEAAEEKINSLRQDIFTLQQERQKYFNNTAESKADEAKMSFLIFKCTEDAETGKPLWKTYDDFKNEEDQGTVNTIVYQFLTFINGLPADFLQLPSTNSGNDEEVEPTDSE